MRPILSLLALPMLAAAVAVARADDVPPVAPPAKPPAVPSAVPSAEAPAKPAGDAKPATDAAPAPAPKPAVEPKPAADPKPAESTIAWLHDYDAAKTKAASEKKGLFVYMTPSWFT